MKLAIALLLAPTLAQAFALPVSEPAVENMSMLDPISGRSLQAQPDLTLQVDALKSCFAPFAFQVLLNAGSVAVNTVKDAVNESISGSQVVTIIILFVILAASVLFLTLGEILINTIVILSTSIGSFMGFLYLWQWACSSTVSPIEGFVKCWLPFILAIVCSLIVTALVAYFIRKFVSLAFFIIGATAGFFGMFLLRNFILSANPQLILEPLFNLYWLGAAAVAIICGFVAICLKDVVIVGATCLIGAYGLAMSIVGLVPAFNGPFLAIWVFYTIFGVSLVAGILFQVCVTRKCCRERRENSRYRAHRKKQQQQQQQQFDGVSMVRP